MTINGRLNRVFANSSPLRDGCGKLTRAATKGHLRRQLRFLPGGPPHADFAVRHADHLAHALQHRRIWRLADTGITSQAKLHMKCLRRRLHECLSGDRLWQAHKSVTRAREFLQAAD